MYPFKKICFETDKSKEEIEQLLLNISTGKYFTGVIIKGKFSLLCNSRLLTNRANEFFNLVFYGKVYCKDNIAQVKFRIGYRIFGTIFHLYVYGAYLYYSFYPILVSENSLETLDYKFHFIMFIFCLIDFSLLNYVGNSFLKKFKEILEIR